jgi:hypothetical protein
MIAVVVSIRHILSRHRPIRVDQTYKEERHHTSTEDAGLVSAADAANIAVFSAV